MLQIQIAELLLNQSGSRRSLFGLENLHEAQHGDESSPAFFPWLSENILATKSIIDVCLSLPSGEEALVPNLDWIALYCGLSLVTRLDIVAAQPQIQYATKQLRRLCDVKLTLRQVVLRLNSVSSKYHGADDCKHALYHLGLRAQRLESWYLQRLPPDTTPSHSASISETYTPYLGMEGPSSSMSSGSDSGLPPASTHGPFPPLSDDAIDDHIIAEMLSQIGSDANFGNFLFTLPGSEEESYS